MMIRERIGPGHYKMRPATDAEIAAAEQARAAKPRMSINEVIAAKKRCKEAKAAGLPCTEFPPPIPIGETITVNLPSHYNCSIYEWHGQALLASRKDKPGGAEIYLSELGDDLQPIWTQPLVMEHEGKTISAEDPRLFTFAGKLHCSFTTYNGEAASVMVARFSHDLQVEKVWYPQYKQRAHWEKNHLFYEHDGELFSLYSVNPHTILRHKGHVAEKVHQVSHGFKWPMHMRGGAIAKVGGEYYHWFHTMQNRMGQFYYSMGLYTFDAAPPFAVRRTVAVPVMIPRDDDRSKVKSKSSVLYPCGAILRDGKFLVSYGYQDHQCRITTFDAGDVERALNGKAIVAKPAAPKMPTTFAITCSQTPDRGANAAKHFAAAGLDVNFYQGIHGKTFGLRTALHGNDEGTYTMPSGHVGLNVTYWSLWQALTLLPGDEWLILEDDAILATDFIQAFQRSYAELPADWQFVYVGHLGVHPEMQAERITDRVAKLSHGYPHGTHATLVRRSALAHLLATNHRAERHIDQQLARYSLPGLKVYAFDPSLAGQHSYEQRLVSTSPWKTIAGVDD